MSFSKRSSDSWPIRTRHCHPPPADPKRSPAGPLSRTNAHELASLTSVSSAQASVCVLIALHSSAVMTIFGVSFSFANPATNPPL